MGDNNASGTQCCVPEPINAVHENATDLPWGGYLYASDIHLLYPCFVQRRGASWPNIRELCFNNALGLTYTYASDKIMAQGLLSRRARVHANAIPR